MKVKRWVAYEHAQGRNGLRSQPLFLVEAETEREALCLASDRAIHLGALSGTAAPFAGPMVHVCAAEDAPSADLLAVTRRLDQAN